MNYSSIVQLRRLTRFAHLMDNLVRLPFLRKGIGLDAVLSVVPIAGDIAGFLLTLYSFYLARKAGVSHRELLPAYRLAVVDAIVGCIPVLGVFFDIAIRPSNKALRITEKHFAIDTPAEKSHSLLSKILGLIVFLFLLYLGWHSSVWLWHQF